jgi:hypothetical protein
VTSIADDIRAGVTDMAPLPAFEEEGLRPRGALDVEKA